VVGAIPAGLPSLRVPTAPLDDALTLIPAALGIFLVSFADAILTARSFAGNRGQHIGVGQELLALGAANAAAGITQSMPVGASGSRTAVNDGMGVRSQVAGLVGAVAVVIVLLFLTGPIAHLPNAVLGAVIIAAATGLIDRGAWRALAQTDRVEVTIAAITAAGVVVTGVLEAIAFAVGLSILDVVRRSARPHDAVLGWVPALGRYADVAVNRAAEVTPGVVVYRLDDRLFFANASYVKGRVREAVRAAPTPTRWVVFDAEGIAHADTAGLAAMGDLVDGLRAEHIGLAVARLKQPMRQRFDDDGLTDRVGAPHFHPTVRAAVAACEAAPVTAGPSPGRR
jgi:MFS superfamily sulfate permease-like transporter